MLKTKVGEFGYEYARPESPNFTIVTLFRKLG